jgi:alpha-D-glucose phosphate-specific phosphoglucomutase
MIRFGTDGWRAIIAEDYTFENVRILAQAIADFLNKENKDKSKPQILIGYDTRFLSNEFAQAVAQVLCANKIKTFLTEKPTPTPVVSFSIVRKRLDGGILITASHNPSKFNGLKFRAHFGGSPDVSITKKIENNLYKSKVKSLSIELAKKRKLFDYLKDLDDKYIKFLNTYVDIKKIKNSNLRILIDPMYGAGMGYLKTILRGGKIKMEETRSVTNPSFGGVNPEPIEKNLWPSIKKMQKENFDICIATDGDADRVGVIDERGVFITPQQVFMLLFIHLVEDKLMRGDLARTISATTILDRIAKRYNLGIHETPVGFKYIVSVMQNQDVLIGGEESGGYSFKNYIPERDGILAGLLLLEMVVERRKKISAILKSIEKVYGCSRFLRHDVHFAPDKKEKFLKKIKKDKPTKLAGQRIKKIQTLDGLKFILEDNSWLLLRFSGTEAVLRIYAETSHLPKTKKLIRAGLRLAST